MKKLRFFLAMAAGKLSMFLMKLLGRNATYLPGKIAIKLCPDFLGQLTPPKTVIAITGTNGKTTTSNLLAAILRENGYRVTNNSLGSNIQAGVATTLLADATFAGKPTRDIAVLEVDERSSLRIYPQLKPDYLVCNNLMRDSIRRNAHTSFIRYIMDQAIPADTKLILNADDLIAAGLAPQNSHRVYFGLDVEKPEKLVIPAVRDLVYCPNCGGELVPEYIRYNHIGRFRCKDCGLASPAPDYLVTQLDREAQTFTLRHHNQEDRFQLLNDNIVNIYNFCGICALLFEMGLSSEQVAKGFAGIAIIKSRYDHVEAGDLKVTIQSAKGQNPIACSQAFRYVAQCPGSNKAVFMLIAEHIGETDTNSESVSWLYDADYFYLADPSIRQVIICGPRCLDQKLRAMLAGVPEENIVLWPDLQGKADLVDTENCKDIYILCDVYLEKEAEAVKNGLLEKAREGVAQ